MTFEQIQTGNARIKEAAQRPKVMWLVLYLVLQLASRNGWTRAKYLQSQLKGVWEQSI